jgi:alkyl hydroperoxide reductase subunit AhpF
MDDQLEPLEQNIFDDETRAQLPSIFNHLPSPVRLKVWGNAEDSRRESEAATLCNTLANWFDTIDYRLLPRREGYPYYPVIGVMGLEEGEEVDFGVRLIGLPAGYQITSLITAIQAVSFRGATLEPRTRISLHRLSQDVTVEAMTSAENEGGALIAKIAFGAAVASRYVKSFLIMSDSFPEVNLRYSVSTLPHTVINGRVHVEGVVDEATLVKHIVVAAGSQ